MRDNYALQDNPKSPRPAKSAVFASKLYQSDIGDNLHLGRRFAYTCSQS